MERMKGVTPRSDGSYEVQYYPEKGIRKSKKFYDLKEANDFKVERNRIEKPKVITIGTVVSDYLNQPEVYIAPSSAYTLSLMVSDNTPITAVDHVWVEDWVAKMKKQSLAPNTIKNKVNQFSKAFSWWLRRNRSTQINPMLGMDRGYAKYKDNRVVNTTRSRRLEAGEYDLCVRAIKGERLFDRREKIWASSDADRASYLMLFQILVKTGFRMREVLYLKRQDVDFTTMVIHSRLEDAGNKKHYRDVPITKELGALLRPYLLATTGAPTDPLLTQWSGVDTDAALTAVGQSVTHRMTNLFKYCKMENITAHDLRHEAISAWLEMKNEDGTWVYRTEEVMAISGHDSTAAFDRYRNFRVESLAARLHA